MRGQRHAPAALFPRERPGTHCTGGWVVPRAGLDRCRKSRPPPGFDPWTVQPVASRYTDYATRPTPRCGMRSYSSTPLYASTTFISRLRQLVACLQTRRLRFNPRPVYVRFVEDEVVVGRVVLPVLRFSPASDSPLLLHAHLCD